MAATGEVSNYHLARNLILSGEAESGERVGQDSTSYTSLQAPNSMIALDVFPDLVW